MRFLRLATTLAVAIAALAVLTTVALAATRSQSSTPVTPLRTRLEQGAGFTRVQTVTIVSAPEATATALTTIWENTWVELNVPFGFPLPADFATITVQGGAYQIRINQPPETTYFGEVYTNRVELTPTAGLPLYLSYYTNSRAVREGNLFRIFILARNKDLTSTYFTTVSFDDSIYEFVSFDDTPTDTLPLDVPHQATGRAGWGPLTVGPNDAIDRYVALGDARLLVDLVVQSYGVILSSDKRSVQVTATVANLGSVATGDKFVLELYDRPDTNPNDPPDGPNDHVGGACKDSQCTIFRLDNARIDNNPYNPAFALQPGQSKLFTFNYTFETGGFRDLYLQVDTFGSAVGFNLEPGSGEDNNIVFLGAYQAVGNIYLPLVSKNK